MGDKQQQSKGKAKGRKIGRDKQKCQSYRGRTTRAMNKIVRIARSNGYQHALEYAAPFGLIGEAKKRLVKFTFGRTEQSVRWR